MNIKISENQIQDHINEIINEAVKDAVKGYSVREAISNEIVEQITCGKLTEAIRKGVDSVDLGSMAQCISEQIAKNTVKAVDYVMKEAMVDMAANLKGLASYSDTYQADKQKIRTEMFREVI